MIRTDATSTQTRRTVAWNFSEKTRAALRSVRRGVLMIAIVLGGVADFFFRVVLPGSIRDAHARAEWLQRWCRAVRWMMHLDIEVRGRIPRSGLLVCNHLGYLDIIALSSLTSCVFVAKSEVARWPAFGFTARLAGTVFVDRSRKADARRVTNEMRQLMRDGVLVVLFPEGTSSGGETVLPFKSSLFEPVAEMRCEVAAGALRYFLASGSVADEVCYWRDMTMLPHLVHLLGLPEIGLVASFSEPSPRAGDRKEIARSLHEEVVSLHERAGLK